LSQKFDTGFRTINQLKVRSWGILILLASTHLGSRLTGGKSHSAMTPVRRSMISSISFPSNSCTSS
jgi:hypothetical protein